MRIETSSNEYDYGHIRINPTIQDQINEMRRKRAESEAVKYQKIAMEAVQAQAVAEEKAERFLKANQELLNRMHKESGWTVRWLMLPAPEVMA